MLMLVLLLPLLFLYINDAHDWGDDFAAFIAQAKAILEGKPYFQTGFVPNLEKPDLVASPIGWSLLLLPVVGVFGTNIIAMKVYLSFFYVLWGIILFVLFRGKKETILAILVVVFTLYYPWLLSFKSEVVSDIPFAATFALSLFSIQKINPRTNLIHCVLLGLLLGLCCLIRPIGFILFAAMAFLFFIRKEYSIYFSKYATVGVAALLLLFVIRNIIFPCEGAYGHYYSFFGRDLVFNVTQNSLFYFSEWERFWMDLTTKALLKNVFLFSSCALLLYGTVRCLWRKNVYAFTVLLYLVIVLIWPYRNQGFRFVFPVLPFLVYVVFERLLHILQAIRPSYTWLAYGIICGLITLSITSDHSTCNNYVKDTGSQTVTAKAMYSYIERNIPNDARVVFPKPRVLCLYSSVHALYPMANMNFEQMQDAYTRYQVKYFVRSKNAGLECYNGVYTNYIDSMEKRKVLLWSNTDFEVYKRKP